MKTCLLLFGGAIAVVALLFFLIATVPLGGGS